MKAMVATTYGPPEVLEINEVAKPATFHLIYQKVEASEVKRQGISQHSHTCALDYYIALTGDESPGKTAPHLVYLH
jgi:hypothetical protein